MALVYRPIFGRFLNVDGTPKHGYVEFTPTVDMVSVGEAIIPLHTVRMDLDVTGRIEGDLACTDSPNVFPIGWLWNVEEKIENGTVWWMQLLQGDLSPFDIISSKVPGVPPPGYQITGTPGPQGPPGPPGPDGGYLAVDFPTPMSQWVLDVGSMCEVVVIDSSHREVWPGNITYGPGTIITLDFSAPFSGKALCFF